MDRLQRVQNEQHKRSNFDKRVLNKALFTVVKSKYKTIKYKWLEIVLKGTVLLKVVFLPFMSTCRGRPLHEACRLVFTALSKI